MIKNNANNTNRAYYSNKTNTANINTLESKKQPLERIRFKIDKSLIIGESEFSLLYKVNDKQTAWISKKICFANNYTNWINVSPIVGAKFKLVPSYNEYEAAEHSDLYNLTMEVSARDFKEIVENNEVNKQWI